LGAKEILKPVGVVQRGIAHQGYQGLMVGGGGRGRRLGEQGSGDEEKELLQHRHFHV
jgi:hypothetical protein